MFGSIRAVGKSTSSLAKSELWHKQRGAGGNDVLSARKGGNLIARRCNNPQFFGGVTVKFTRNSRRVKNSQQTALGYQNFQNVLISHQAEWILCWRLASP
jgi:hypothetical protein